VSQAFDSRKVVVRLLSATIFSAFAISEGGVALADCISNSNHEIVCDTSPPNPSTGAYGNNIHILSDVTVLPTFDPYAGVGSSFTTAIVYTNGTLTADVRSTVANFYQDAITIDALAGATLSINGAVSSTGANSRAVILDAGSSLSLGASGLIQTSGNGSTLFPTSNHSVVIGVTGSGTTIDIAGTVRSKGDFAPAILAGARDPISGTLHFYTSAITIEQGGVVETLGASSNAIEFGGGTLVNNGTVRTSGNNSIGINANSADHLTISGTGNVTTAGSNATAIAATSDGDIKIDVGAISTSGGGSAGIVASSTNGGVSITAANVQVNAAGARAILANGAEAVSIVVGAAGAVDGPAIVATSLNNSVSATLNGAASGGGGTAVRLGGATTASLSLGAAGVLTAAGGGVELVAPGGLSLNNAGSITGDDLTPIITASSAALSFVNSGTFTGLIALGDGDDSVTNKGTYRVLSSQDFGGGANRFENAGTLAILAGRTTPGTVNFAHLGAFANSGLIDMRNGHAGDVLNLSGDFAGSGGSALAVDVAAAPASSGRSGLAVGQAAALDVDQLNVAGKISGSTIVILNPVGSNKIIPQQNQALIFATGGAGSSPTAFSLAPQSSDQGFTKLAIGYDVTANAYSLIATPSDALFRTLKISEGAQQLWTRSADVWAAHMSELRDRPRADGQSKRLWGQIYGQSNSRDATQNVSAFGTLRTADISYRQAAFGGQIGVDLGGDEQPFGFGITAGYANSNLRFRAAPDRVTFDAANIGAYARYASDRFFANLLVD
jgi:hypothetical protein